LAAIITEINYQSRLINTLDENLFLQVLYQDHHRAGCPVVKPGYRPIPLVGAVKHG
jgi:hypothetical protein